MPQKFRMCDQQSFNIGICNALGLMMKIWHFPFWFLWVKDDCFHCKLLAFGWGADKMLLCGLTTYYDSAIVAARLSWVSLVAGEKRHFECRGAGGRAFHIFTWPGILEKAKGKLRSRNHRSNLLCRKKKKKSLHWGGCLSICSIWVQGRGSAFHIFAQPGKMEKDFWGSFGEHGFSD